MTDRPASQAVNEHKMYRRLQIKMPTSVTPIDEQHVIGYDAHKCQAKCNELYVVLIEVLS